MTPPASLREQAKQIFPGKNHSGVLYPESDDDINRIVAFAQAYADEQVKEFAEKVKTDYRHWAFSLPFNVSSSDFRKVIDKILKERSTRK